MSIMSPSDPFSDFNMGEKTVIRPSPRGRRRAKPQITAMAVPPYAKGDARLQQVTFAEDNPLVAEAFALLSLVSKLRSTPFHDAVNILQERLADEIRRFENRALEKGSPKNQVDIAKYFLCALLDETVLNTPWGSQSGWGHNSLSSLFYKKLVAGEEFFQILDQVKRQPVKNKALIEFAHLCLSFGFEGKFRYMNNGLLSLERERQELFFLLQRIKGDREPALSIHWQGLLNKQNRLVRHIPLWVVGGIAGVLLMVVYMAFALAIQNHSDRLYGQLVAIGQSIQKKPSLQLALPIQEKRQPSVLKDRLKQELSEQVAHKQVAIIDGPIIRIFNMFPSGRAEVSKEYYSTLATISRMLKTQRVHIRIVGHTDNQKLKFSTRFKSNWHLSLARAEHTAKVLCQYGLERNRIRFEGMADQEPITSNETKADRALNRRMDIHIR